MNHPSLLWHSHDLALENTARQLHEFGTRVALQSLAESRPVPLAWVEMITTGIRLFFSIVWRDFRICSEELLLSNLFGSKVFDL